MTRQTIDQRLAPATQAPPATAPATAPTTSPSANVPTPPARPALRVPPVPRSVRVARADRRRWVGRVRRRAARCRDATRTAAEAGMSTAEYAVGTIAACGFAAVLYKIVTSGPVRSALTGVIVKALHVPF